MSDTCGRFYYVHHVWQMTVPTTLLMPRGMCGPFCCTGVQWRLQYCGDKCRRLQYSLCQGSCGALFLQVYRVWSLYRGLTRVLLSLFVPGPFRAGVPGRMAPVGFGCAGRRRAVRRVLTYPGRRDVGLESEVGLGAGLPIEEAGRRRLEPEASAPIG